MGDTCSPTAAVCVGLTELHVENRLEIACLLEGTSVLQQEREGEKQKSVEGVPASPWPGPNIR